MKLTVVGAGTAGCFTALYCAWYGRKHGLEVEVLYDPDIPPEPVGQATLLTPPHLLFQTHGFNWYKNPIHAKFKTGILYKGWGKKQCIPHQCFTDTFSVGNHAFFCKLFHLSVREHCGHFALQNVLISMSRVRVPFK